LQRRMLVETGWGKPLTGLVEQGYQPKPRRGGKKSFLGERNKEKLTNNPSTNPGSDFFLKFGGRGLGKKKKKARTLGKRVPKNRGGKFRRNQKRILNGGPKKKKLFHGRKNRKEVKKKGGLCGHLEEM